MLHALQDGDRVLVSWRMDDGRLTENEIEFGGLVVDSDGKAFVEEVVYRPDTGTDIIPLERMVGIRSLRHDPSPSA
jgi:hypothetical protein